MSQLRGCETASPLGQVTCWTHRPYEFPSLSSSLQIGHSQYQIVPLVYFVMSCRE